MGGSEPEELDLHNIEHSVAQLSVTDDRIYRQIELFAFYAKLLYFKK